MKHLMLAITLLTAFVLASCATPPPAATSAPVPISATHDENADEAETEIRELVEHFGKTLRNVSLQAPTAAQDLQQQYSEFVSPALLEAWMNDVFSAPGRMVSSPWPDRIEITSLESETSDKYVIRGFVVEMTSTEVGSDEAANKIPVQMLVERRAGRWLITEYREER